MATQILDNASFSVLRTNPKLTTNAKIVVNENDIIFLDTFNANTELSNSKFKGFKLDPNSSYDKDLNKFFSNGQFPKDKAYEILQKSDDLSVLSKYDLQYEMFYAAGCEAITSDFYDEELGILAPIWLNEIIPDYFVVFRIDGPVSVNNINATDENEGVNEVSDPNNFIKNIISKSTIIKTFDLSDKSSIGKYIRNYRSQVDFPEGSLRVSMRRDEMSYWNGISYDDGGFASKGDNIYDEFVNRDSSIIEKEYFLTKGFERNGIVNANLLNLQFLFTDNDVNDYEIHRYFGLYVSEAQEGSFLLDGKNFFRKAKTHPSQSPRPGGDDDIKVNEEFKFEFINPNGVVLYIDPNTIDTVTSLPTPSLINNIPSFFYVKDQNNKFHNIKTGSQWNENELRVADTTLEIGDFTGFEPSVTDAFAELLDDRGRSMALFNINGTLPAVFSVSFYDDNKLLGIVAVDPSITDVGTANGLYFCGNGTNKQIAKAMAAAIDNIPKDVRYFDALQQGNDIILVSRFFGDRFNKLRFELNPLLVGDHFTHTPNIPTDSNPNAYNFIGGSGDQFRRFKISNADIDRFTTDRYVKTKAGYARVVQVAPLIDQATKNISNEITAYSQYNTHSSVIIEGTSIPDLSGDNRVSLFEVFRPKFGRFTIFPIKDMDIDFYSDEYFEQGELFAEFDEYTKTLDDGETLTAKATHPDIIDFYEKGFGRLQGILEEDSAEGSVRREVDNEYDRLKENFVLELANVSRVVPYINKWVYYNGTDVRNKGYRLNTSDAFGIYNFTPSKDNFDPDPDAYTHEWPLLSQVPDYFTPDDIKRSWSYFDRKVRDRNTALGIIGDFHDNTIDNFTDYFTNDRLSTPFGYISKDKDIRYSRLLGGDDENFAEAFFRGVKVIAKKRSENNKVVNFNTNNLEYVKDEEFNGYKFAAILIPHEVAKPTFQIKFVENKKWKTITMMIFLNVDYAALDGGREFIDRTLLYALKSKIETNTSGDEFQLSAPYNYSDTIMQGSISIQNSKYTSFPYIIKGAPDSNGVSTNFVQDIKIGPDGKYNDIKFEVTTGSGQGNWVISNIQKIINEDTLIAGSFDKIDGPGGTGDINNIILKPADSILSTIQFNIDNGGYLDFVGRMRLASFANIYERVNQGHPDIIYETVNEDNTIENNRFIIQLATPPQVIKPTYLQVLTDEDKPTAFNLSETIGYRVAMSEKIKLTPFFRHFGLFNPKFKDVIKFEDPYITKGFDSTDTLTEYESKVFNEMRYANTAFKLDDPKFGLIENFFYHKVNQENKGNVLELPPRGAFKSKYPLIGETAIDKRDLFVFRSSWDPGYFVKHTNKTRSSLVIGTRSHIEKKSFLASKAMKTPQSISLETFTINELPANSFLNIANNLETIVGTAFYTETDDTIKIKTLVTKRLREFLFDGVLSEFKKYIKPEFGFGSLTTLNDDVNEYINKNLIPRYRINDVNLYIKQNRTEGTTDYSTMELNDSNKLSLGLNAVKNFTNNQFNRNLLDFELTFNKTRGYNYQIGLSVELIRK